MAEAATTSRTTFKKNHYPRDNSDFSELREVIRNFILDETTLPKLSETTGFFLQGSCFTENLTNELKRRGRQCHYEQVVEAYNSPLANFVYFRDLAGNPQQPSYQALQKADVLILTVGVAPCWFRRDNGHFELTPDARELHLYFQRNLTVAESNSAFAGIFDAVYKINPAIDIVFTVSPVALNRTFEFSSGIVADCVSKSTLRASAHETMMGYRGKKPYYFPSFEIVRWLGAHRGDAFGDDGLPRHVSKHYAAAIIAAFLEATKAD